MAEPEAPRDPDAPRLDAPAEAGADDVEAPVSSTPLLSGGSGRIRAIALAFALIAVSVGAIWRCG